MNGAQIFLLAWNNFFSLFSFRTFHIVRQQIEMKMHTILPKENTKVADVLKIDENKTMKSPREEPKIRYFFQCVCLCVVEIRNCKNGSVACSLVRSLSGLCSASHI